MVDGKGLLDDPAEAFAATRSVPDAPRLVSVRAEKLMHYETRGCLFDFCESRADVKAKLSAGCLCGPVCTPHARGTFLRLCANLINAVRLCGQRRGSCTKSWPSC